jgi:hypothetical protein
MLVSLGYMPDLGTFHTELILCINGKLAPNSEIVRQINIKLMLIVANIYCALNMCQALF